MSRQYEGSGSPDEFFTKEEVLQEIASIVKSKVDTSQYHYVDFSCGRNTFASHLNPSSYKSFDINTANLIYGTAEQQDWLTVSALFSPIPIIIGLNPPFGYRHKTLNEFVVHAHSMNPAYLLLITPRQYTLTAKVAPFYDLVEKRDLPLDSFYRPADLSTFEYPTTFWIFQRRSTKREPEKKTKDPRFDMKLVYTADDIEGPHSLLVRISGTNAGRAFWVQHAKKLFEYVHWDLKRPKQAVDHWDQTGVATKRYYNIHGVGGYSIDPEQLMHHIYNRWYEEHQGVFPAMSYSIRRTTLEAYVLDFLNKQ